MLYMSCRGCKFLQSYNNHFCVKIVCVELKVTKFKYNKCYKDRGLYSEL